MTQASPSPNPQDNAPPLTTTPTASPAHPGFTEATRGLQLAQIRFRRFTMLATAMVITMTVGFVGLLARVVYLQVSPQLEISQLVRVQQQGLVDLAGRRGSLLDRKGRVVATTGVAYRLYVDAKIIEDFWTFSQQVGQHFGYDPQWILQRLSRQPQNRFIVLDESLSDERVQQLEGFNLPGLGWETHLVRHYPLGPLAGQVVGFVGRDGQGLEGIEKLYESFMQGRSGGLSYVRAANRMPLWIESQSYQLPQAGKAVQLSLDAVVQAIAQEQLGAACRQYGAESGQLIVMVPSTGEILAMANYPEFDPNDLSVSTAVRRRNRCVTDVFEPGSTFKPFIWAFAVEWGLARPEELIDCHEGFYVSPEGRRLRDAHGYGLLTFEQVLTKSSNIGMAVVGQRLGEKRLFAAVSAMGFGKPTNSRLPGESPGLVRPLAKWNHYSETSVPMGQEIGVTPLQLVRGLSILINDGLMVTPTILAREKEAAEPAQDELQIREQVVSRSTSRILRQALRKVVTEGTGQNANSKMYEVFGKTGTAQVADLKRGGYLPNAYVGSFIGGAPADKPQIVVGCFIHRPNAAKGYYGGTVAAPAVKRVIEEILSYMGVPPLPEPTDKNAQNKGTLAIRD
ncbi:MAG: penicillin-binding protein 2 [Phycisphaeraceae bacterium]|nr:penicillin-binding protein 2 [Phycisphaeraceae bacterium]